MTFTYAQVGITREPRSAAPQGLRRMAYESTVDIPFADAVEVLFTWEMHRRAGLRPVANTARVAVGVVVTQRFGPLRAPCRVVWVVEEPGRAGFAYGTLAGHPECGEESFVLEEGPGGVRFTVTAFSRPGRWFTRIAGPVSRVVQAFIVRRYARAFRG